MNHSVEYGQGGGTGAEGAGRKACSGALDCNILGVLRCAQDDTRAEARLGAEADSERQTTPHFPFDKRDVMAES